MSELNLRRLEMDLIGGHRNPVYETVAEIIKDRDRLRAIEAAAREVVESHSGERSAIDFANVSLRKLIALRLALSRGTTRE